MLLFPSPWLLSFSLCALIELRRFPYYLENKVGKRKTPKWQNILLLSIPLFNWGTLWSVTLSLSFFTYTPIRRGPESVVYRWCGKRGKEFKHCEWGDRDSKQHWPSHGFSASVTNFYKDCYLSALKYRARALNSIPLFFMPLLSLFLSAY